MRRAVLFLGIGTDIGDFQIGEFNALNGVSVDLSVRVQRALSRIAAEDILHAGITDAGGDVAGIPHAVFFRICNVVLVDVKGAGPVGIDRGYIHRQGKGGYGRCQHDQHCHDNGKELLTGFLHCMQSLLLFLEMMIRKRPIHAAAKPAESTGHRPAPPAMGRR